MLLLGPQAVRNGADVWLRQLLDLLGFGQYFLLPVMTIGLLLAWHHVTQRSLAGFGGVVYVMFAECAVLGLVLVGLGRLQAWSRSRAIWQSRRRRVRRRDALDDGRPQRLVGRLVGFIGAGVYEEMLFRLMLLPPVAVCA